jgi:hypothetical protein
MSDAPVGLDRLAKLLGLIGSDHDGEVVAAARKADELRRAAGLTWAQLLDSEDAKRRVEIATDAARMLLSENERLRDELAYLKAAIERPVVPQPWSDSETLQDGAQACLLWDRTLDQLGTGFLQSLLRRRRILAKRQAEVLGRIGEKVDRAIRNTWCYRGRAA